jgi:hypothetical protein
MAILVEKGFQYPVFIDGMIWDANGIFTAYPEYLSRNMQKKIFSGEDPFLNPIFKRIASQSEREKAWEEKPCVIISTSGMLIGGPVMEHLKALAENPNNTLMFVGYQCVKGETEILFDGHSEEIRKIFKLGMPLIKTEKFELRKIDEILFGVCLSKNKLERSFAPLCSRRKYQGEIIRILTEDGRELFLSPEHPVLVKDHSWKQAGKLSEKDEIWVVE